MTNKDLIGDWNTHTEGKRLVHLRDGEPYIGETRIPVAYIWGWIKEGKSIDDFLEDFSSVTREQVIEIINLSEKTFAERVNNLENSMG